MATYYVDGAAGNDANAGTSAGAAKATVQAGLNLISAGGDVLNIKASAVYSVSTGLTCPAGPSFSNIVRVRGYTTTPGDGGQATIRATAGVTIFTVGRDGLVVTDLDLDGDNVASTRGVEITGALGSVARLKVRNCKNGGLYLSVGAVHARDCEVTGCSSAGYAVSLTSGTVVSGLYVHDNTVPGIENSGGSCGSITRCVVAGNTGIGINLGYNTVCANNSIYNNTSDGIRVVSSFIGIAGIIRNNILTSNGGYGIKMASAPGGTQQEDFDYNAFGSGGVANTSGPRSGLDVGPHDVTLTADPYTNAAGGDFSLNNTAGAGAACRAAGFPGVFPGGLSTGYLDIGAAQHQDAGGGGGGGGWGIVAPEGRGQRIMGCFG